MWPTPVATDAAGARRSTARTPAWTSKPGTTLLDAVIETGALWPTLRAHDGDGPGGRDSATEGGPSLPAAVQLWPTPTASEYGTSQGGINKTRPSGHTPSLFTMARRQGAPLNPAWVETLTGLPIGWSCPADGLRREDGRNTTGSRRARSKASRTGARGCGRSATPSSRTSRGSPVSS